MKSKRELLIYEMDIISLVLKQLKGFNPLAIGYIIVCIIVFKLRYETKKDLKIMEKQLEQQEKQSNDKILGFMKEVNESIKEERKLNYQIINGIDKEIHDVLRKLGECIGELRGNKGKDK